MLLHHLCIIRTYIVFFLINLRNTCTYVLCHFTTVQRYDTVLGDYKLFHIVVLQQDIRTVLVRKL